MSAARRAGAPLVSVITANYNNARHLPAALDSIRSQTLSSWEWIVVDDASTDAGPEIVSRAAAGDPRIRLFRQATNCGPGAARNRAVSLARGKWTAVFDGDDLMAPDRLQRLVDRAIADGAAIVADGLLLFSDESARLTHFLPASFRRGPRWITLERFIDSNRLYTATPDLGFLKPLIATDVIRRSGLRYDETLRIGEDYDFLARLMAAGHDLRLEPDSLYHYRKHSGSTSHRSVRADVQGQITADWRMLATVRPLNRGELAAFRRRQRSLQSLILYDEAISLLKAGALAAGLDHILRHARIWPLMTRPLRARWTRWAKAIGRWVAAATAPIFTRPAGAEQT